MMLALLTVCFAACKDKLAPVAADAIQPKIITAQTVFDTDDPAIWIDKNDYAKSLIIGTDKEDGGGIYLYDFQGKVVTKYLGMQRPNNVDVAYDFLYGDTLIDIAVVTERNTNKIRVFSLPDLMPIDNGGIAVFESEPKEFRAPTGIALFTKKEQDQNKVYAIVGRKDGPSEGYLGQYELRGDGQSVQATLVRKFGKYSGSKEIEAIAVDNELGFVYYSDETKGVRKYYADPQAINEELAFFAQDDAKRDHEGIAIYKKTATTGYILVSDQQANSFLVYAREGTLSDGNEHKLITTIPVSAIECDGAEVTALPINDQFPLGALVAMSNGKVFHIYDWRDIQAKIDHALKSK